MKTIIIDDDERIEEHVKLALKADKSNSKTPKAHSTDNGTKIVESVKKEQD